MSAPRVPSRRGGGRCPRSLARVCLPLLIALQAGLVAAAAASVPVSRPAPAENVTVLARQVDLS
ncbi:MAG: hypothetical protein ABR977_10835, partial [Candidatus Dormibacteria bacterium]